jgi:GntR family carbon starvation induced transcriptional regulator
MGFSDSYAPIRRYRPRAGDAGEIADVLKRAKTGAGAAMQRAPNGAAAPDGPRTLVESAFAALKRDILAGTLKPGAKLRTRDLRETYGLGASTMREALTRLMGESLVTAEGQRGFRVAPVSLDDFNDLSEVRKMVETAALEQSIARGDEEWEGRVVAAFHRLSKVEERLAADPVGSVQAYEERNQEFHRALLSSCPSPWLHRLHDMLYHQSERYRRIALSNRPPPRDLHAEHQAIFDAALARDIEKAKRFSIDHIERTVEVLRGVLTSRENELAKRTAPERRSRSGDPAAAPRAAPSGRRPRAPRLAG